MGSTIIYIAVLIAFPLTLAGTADHEVNCTSLTTQFNAKTQALFAVTYSSFQEVTNRWKTDSKQSEEQAMPFITSCLEDCCKNDWCDATYFHFENVSSHSVDSLESSFKSCWLVACEESDCGKLLLENMASFPFSLEFFLTPRDAQELNFLMRRTRQVIPETSSVASIATARNESQQGSAHTSSAQVSMSLPFSNNESSVSTPTSSTHAQTTNSITSITSSLTAAQNASSSTSWMVTHLELLAGPNTTLQLPNNTVKLEVHVVDQSQINVTTLNYKWSIVQQPSGAEKIGEIEDFTSPQVTLSQLIAGTYVLSVQVSALPLSSGDTKRRITGESVVVVKVEPSVKAPNVPPIARIKPPSLTIQLPTQQVAFDGRESSDSDGHIVEYLWHMVAGPLGLSVQPEDSKDQMWVLELHDVGNYTVRLTVTDDAGATNWTLGHLTLLAAPNAPPRALVDAAQKQVVLTLPQNAVALDGSPSSDDGKIKSYVWLKLDGPTLADLQGTNQPVLHLSNLVEGTYVFQLTVTDDAGQTDSTTVTVFVRARINQPPVARIHVPDDGVIEVRLPVTQCLLDASDSSDDTRITHFNWSQTSGPIRAQLVNSDSNITTAQRLTMPGDYVFLVRVRDEDAAEANTTVLVRVLPNNRKPPTARCAEPYTRVFWPLHCAVLDARASHDPLGSPIDHFQWSRLPDSLAAGYLLQSDSDTAVICQVVPGIYRFSVLVSNSDGLTNTTTCTLEVVPLTPSTNFSRSPVDSSTDAVSIIMHKPQMNPDGPRARDLVELRLRTQLSSFRELDKLTLTRQLATFLEKQLPVPPDSSVSVCITSLSETRAGGDLLVVFYVTVGHSTDCSLPATVLDGRHLADVLDNRLTQLGADALLQFEPLALDTSVCTNDCSGHGVCDERTRECLCDRYWLPSMGHSGSFFSRSLRPSANCAWSVLYVALVAVLLFAISVAIVVCLCRCRHRDLQKRERTSALRLRVRRDRSRATERIQMRRSRRALPTGPRTLLAGQEGYQPLRNEQPSDVSASDEDLFSQRPAALRSVPMQSLAQADPIQLADSTGVLQSELVDVKPSVPDEPARRRRASSSSDISSSPSESTRHPRLPHARNGHQPAVEPDAKPHAETYDEDMPNVIVRDHRPYSPFSANVKRPNPFADDARFSTDATAAYPNGTSGNGENNDVGSDRDGLEDDGDVKQFGDTQPRVAASFRAVSRADEIGAHA